MPTPAQIFANKLNAKKSTGPRTADGKARSSLNSLKHGLCAEAAVLPYEDPEEYEHLRDVIHRDFAAQSEFEVLHLDLLARAYWRMIRSSRVECGMFTKRLIALADKEHAEHMEMDFDQGISVCYIHFAKEFDLHRRYETAIERSYYKALGVIKSLRGTIAGLQEQANTGESVNVSGAGNRVLSAAVSAGVADDNALSPAHSEPLDCATPVLESAAAQPSGTNDMDAAPPAGAAPSSPAPVLVHPSQPSESVTQSGIGFVSRDSVLSRIARDGTLALHGTESCGPEMEPAA